MESAIGHVHAMDNVPDIVLETSTPLLCHVEFLATTRPNGGHPNQTTKNNDKGLDLAPQHNQPTERETTNK